MEKSMRRGKSWAFEGEGEEEEDLPFISLFMITPVSGTINWEPNRRFTVLVRLVAIPEASAVTICEVPGLEICEHRSDQYVD